MQIDIYAVPLIIGFINAWIIAIVLFYRSVKHDRYSDRIFGFLLICISFLLIHYMFGYMGINILWNELHFFPVDPTFLIGPLIYFYFKSQVNTNFRLGLSSWWHFVPFGLYTLAHLIVFFQGRDYVAQWTEKFYYFESIMLLFMFISMAIYFVLTIRLYSSYRKWLENEMPDSSSLSFRWFNSFLIAIFITSVIMWTFTFLNIIGVSLDYNQNVWQHIFLSAILVFIGLEAYAQKQPLYMDFDPNKKDDLNIISSNQVNLEKDNSINEKLKIRVLQSMKDHRLFLNPELNLRLLSSELGASKSDVSFLINQAFEKNFREFVNYYRVEAVCEALRNNQQEQFSLFGIAMNSGFNSKATFNRVFKELKGITPIQYVSQYNDEQKTNLKEYKSQ